MYMCMLDDMVYMHMHARTYTLPGQKSTTLPSTGRYKAGQSAVHQPLPHVPGRGGSDSGSNSPNDSGTGSVNIRFSKVSSERGVWVWVWGGGGGGCGCGGVGVFMHVLCVY